MAEVKKIHISGQEYGLADEVARKSITTQGETIAAQGQSITKLRGDFDSMMNADTNGAIDKFNEIVEFLEGVDDNETLNGVVEGIAKGLDNNAVLPFSGVVDGDITTQQTGATEFSAVLWSTAKNQFVARQGMNYYLTWTAYEKDGVSYPAASVYNRDDKNRKLYLNGNITYAFVGDQLKIVGDDDMRSISVTALDDMASDTASFLELAKTPHIYAVKADVSGSAVVVGRLEVISDTLLHGITQVLTTHYTLNDDGTLNTDGHDHTHVFIYQRFRARNGESMGAWSAWKPQVDIKEELQNYVKVENETLVFDF